MDPISDSDYLYLAREALRAKLPSVWQICKSRTNQIFYYNQQTRVLQLTHPVDEYYKR